MRKILFYLIAFVYLSSEVSAAVLIDTSYKPGNTRRLLYYAIPDNYDATKKYPLVVGLHPCMGAEGTGKTYRNSLTPLADSLQVIIACPDNSGSVFGDEKLITAVADSARFAYNIDTTAMFLTGMSCNGEYTLNHGLKKFYPFAGIFPWVPWVNSKSQIQNYLINSDMPTVLAVGTNDENYSILMSLYDSLKAEGANVNLVLALKVGHQQNFPEFGNTMITCIRYLTSPKIISLSKIDDFQLLNTDAPKEVSVNVSTSGSKLLKVNVILNSDNQIENPIVTYDAILGKATFNIIPKTNRSGPVKVIVEACEIDGPAIAQSVFNLKINKPTASPIIEASSNKLFVSPNPANGYITLESQNPVTEFEIYDLSGKQVLKGNCVERKATINVSVLPRGNYFIVATASNETARFCLE